MLGIGMRIVCLTHVSFEGPARIESWAKLRGHKLRTVRADLESLPAPSSADMLIVMGGPMSVNDELDWLRDEALLVETYLRTKRPILGVCLGAQMLAKVLGARVYPSGVKEIGWWNVECRELEPALSPPLPRGFIPLHWHGETFDLPQGAERLARSEAVENQAFLANRNAVGLQFHIEATPRSVEELVAGAGKDIDSGRWQQSAETILAERFARADALESTCFGVLDWLIALPTE